MHDGALVSNGSWVGSGATLIVIKVFSQPAVTRERAYFMTRWMWALGVIFQAGRWIDWLSSGIAMRLVAVQLPLVRVGIW